MPIGWTNRILTIIALALPLACLSSAEVFKSQSECIVGHRVADKADKKGTIVRVPRNDTMCFVHLDQTPAGQEQAYIFWMLRAEGASVETSDKLVPGVYECFAGVPNAYTFMDLRIASADTYVWASQQGKYRVEQPSHRIVFGSGPLQNYTAKLLAGPSVGLNTDGGSFFGTHCDLKK